MALDDGNYTTVVNMSYPKYFRVADAPASLLTIFENAGAKALSMQSEEPRSYDETAIEDWAKAVVYGIGVLTGLKNQLTLLRLQPYCTRGDASATSPFTRASLAGEMNAIKGMRIPPVCYPLAEIFTRIIQVGGAEKLNSIDSQFVMPFVHGMSVSNFEDQLDGLDALQKAPLFAKYIGKPLVPIYENWLKTPHIVPYYSDWAQAIFELIPIESNSGGVAQHCEDFTGDVDVYYNQTVGMSQLISAAALFREDTSYSGTSEVLAIVAPSADKLSLGYYDTKAQTTRAEVPDTTERFDYIFQVSEARSADMRGWAAHGDNFVQYHTLKGDETAWDRKLSNLIFSKIVQPKWEVNCLSRLMPSITSKLNKPGVKLKNANQSKYGSMSG
jgi:hypothetical protein